MENTEKAKIRLVRDLRENDFILVSDSQDIEATLDSIGKNELIRNNEVGCLFVEIADGDYSQVWACERSVPYLDAHVWQLV